MSDSMRLTAVIITYKRPDELTGALANVLTQDMLPDEILVYDDDPEGSGRVAAGLDHPLVRYIVARENRGPAGARTQAAQEASGQLLLFLDDDCRFARADTVRLIGEICTEPSRALVSFLIKDAASNSIVARNYPGRTLTLVDRAHDISYFSAGGFAVRREIFLEMEGFDPILYHGEEELDLSLRLINQGWRLHYDPRVIILHRESPAGREGIRRSYRHIRNRLYLAVKHMPFPYVLSHILIWSGFTFFRALRRRQAGEYWRGVASLWKDGLWREALHYRREHPMTRETVAYLRRHDGRLLY